jgi:hypothetical protein
MLTHPTLDQMQALGLGGMATAYRELAEQNSADDLSRDEWLGLMLDREAAIRGASGGQIVCQSAAAVGQSDFNLPTAERKGDEAARGQET